MDERRILVVDDDADMARAIADAISCSRYRCEVATSGSAALALCRQIEFDVVISDIRLGEMDGMELMSRLHATHREMAVILMTGEASIAAAVDAVKRGAFEYLTKPCDPKVLRALIAEVGTPRGQAARSTKRRALPTGTEELVGRSTAIHALRAQIELVATSVSPVLINGETGTGKELVARAIHACSPRRARPFVTVNATAIPESLLESEVFGHARGAFTGASNTHRGVFQEADGGTLLLDEIGDLPLALQPKLLRVLQEGEVRPVGAERPQQVDVRVIASTHRRLGDLVREGRFREDLYYRLNVVPLHVPPLRDRTEDLPDLIACLLARARARAPGSPARIISPELADLLASQTWAGNVRELESTIERLVVLARGAELKAEDLAMAVGHPVAPEPIEDPSLDRLIQRHVEAILLRTAGNKARAAKLLGIDLSTLYRWQRKWETP